MVIFSVTSTLKLCKVQQRVVLSKQNEKTMSSVITYTKKKTLCLQKPKGAVYCLPFVNFVMLKSFKSCKSFFTFKTSFSYSYLRCQQRKNLETTLVQNCNTICEGRTVMGKPSDSSNSMKILMRNMRFAKTVYMDHSAHQYLNQYQY